jgi:hypothetical protein
MSANIQRLHSAIAAVCPIHGVSSGGRIDFSEAATAAQREAATTIAMSFDLEAPVVPTSVTLYQGRAALIEAGLFNDVKSAVTGLGEASLAFQAFEYANHWYRDSPFIAQLAGALGLTDAQIDELFIAAEAL